MILDGTVNKIGILLLLCFITAAVSWNNPNPVLMYTGLGVGFVIALITSFKPTVAPTTAPIYALA
ncbi:MAG: Bax inhibitor-1/YccA family protein [Candidatus Azotimanducaceae bacterium]